jgi:hypothetical protein
MQIFMTSLVGGTVGGSVMAAVAGFIKNTFARRP